MNGILVIRPGAIGDALLTFPVLKALREHYAGMPITLVSNAQVLPLALAFGVAEQTFDFQDITWSELFSTTGIRNSSLLALLKQTDLAICWMRDTDGIVKRNLSLSGVKHVVIAPGRPAEGERIHIVDYLANTIGLPIAGPRFIAPSSWPTPNPFSNRTIDLSIAIHPGSGSAQKCWPASRFAAVIERLWQQNRSVLLLAGPADSERVFDVFQQLSSPPTPEMLKLLPNAPLMEVARQLQPCRCYLGNDSGITHLAAMLGVPTVAIFGPTDPAIWRPMGPSVHIIQGSTLEEVSIDSVVEAIELMRTITWN
jgi:Glycosyltransferase family 9 (heptosyltransferase)